MRTRALLLMACCLASLPALAGEEAEADLQRGRALLDRRQYRDALKVFKAALGAQGKRCVPCLLGMADAEIGLGEPDEALERCDKVLKLEPEDARVKARAFNLRGLALLQAARRSERLRDAEDSFRKAIELAPEDLSLHFNLGHVLLQESRDDEGIAELKRFLDHAPAGRAADRASQ